MRVPESWAAEATLPSGGGAPVARNLLWDPIGMLTVDPSSSMRYAARVRGTLAPQHHNPLTPPQSPF
jgi:hypothetical protein